MIAKARATKGKDLRDSCRELRLLAVGEVDGEFLSRLYREIFLRSDGDKLLDYLRATQEPEPPADSSKPQKKKGSKSGKAKTVRK